MSVYNPIFVRSPRIINVLGTTVGDVATCEIYITNLGTPLPSTPTYTLNKPIPTANNLTVHFDISPYCREFIDHLKYVEVNDMTVADNNEWCLVKVVTYINKVALNTTYYAAFDGFGYYTQGYNPDLGEVFLDEGTYYVEQNQLLHGGIFYYGDGNALWDVEYESLASGLTTTYNLDDSYNYVPYIDDNYVGEGNIVRFYKDTVLYKTFTFEEVCEPKYTPLKCDFVNKYGSWQRIVFFKASRQNFEANGTEFHLMPDSINYSIYENRKQTFNRNAIRSIKANTGFVPESYKEVMKQLLLSEKIMIDDEPVKLRTQSVELQEHITKKLINYELEFEYSHEQRNYVI